MTKNEILLLSHKLGYFNCMWEFPKNQPKTINDLSSYYGLPKSWSKPKLLKALANYQRMHKQDVERITKNPKNKEVLYYFSSVIWIEPTIAKVDAFREINKWVKVDQKTFDQLWGE